MTKLACHWVFNVGSIKDRLVKRLPNTCLQVIPLNSCLTKIEKLAGHLHFLCTWRWLLCDTGAPIHPGRLYIFRADFLLQKSKKCLGELTQYGLIKLLQVTG